MPRNDKGEMRLRRKATTPTSRGTRRSSLRDDAVGKATGERRGRGGVHTLLVVLVVLAALLAIVLVGGIILAHTPVFTIVSIDAPPTEHLTADNIAKLASVEEGTTLLNVDETLVSDNIKRNPWVKSVSLSREFPDQLRIEVTERRVDCLVAMSSGRVCWCLGDDYVWIEPVNLAMGSGRSVEDVALATAREMDALLITNVPSSVSPRASSATTDEVILAVQQYREQLSNDLLSQIISFSAQSVDSLACTLESGVEISLGAPNNIDTKESVIMTILSKHPNQITYINVRMPAQATYRMIGTESVDAGTGIQTDFDDLENPETTQESESETTDGETETTDGESETTDGESETTDDESSAEQDQSQDATESQDQETDTTWTDVDSSGYDEGAYDTYDTYDESYDAGTDTDASYDETYQEDWY